jgi:HTH-type transcriptional regulator/antitoxin HipB
MLIRTPKDLGAVIRDHRRRRGLDQLALATKIGVSRQWVVEVEKGKPRAEVGLVLRALDALGVALSIPATDPVAKKKAPGIDIDQIVDKARKPDK